MALRISCKEVKLGPPCTMLVAVDIDPFPEGDAERTDAPDKWFDNDSIDSVEQLSRYYLEAESVPIEDRRRGCSGSGYRKLPRGG